MGNPWVEEFLLVPCFLSLSPPASELAIIDVIHIINIFMATYQIHNLWDFRQRLYPNRDILGHHRLLLLASQLPEATGAAPSTKGESSYMPSTRGPAGINGSLFQTCCLTLSPMLATHDSWLMITYGGNVMKRCYQGSTQVIRITPTVSGQITRISSRVMRLEPTCETAEFLANLWPRLSLTAVSGFKALLWLNVKDLGPVKHRQLWV